MKKKKLVNVDYLELQELLIQQKEQKISVHIFLPTHPLFHFPIPLCLCCVLQYSEPLFRLEMLRAQFLLITSPL